MDGFEEELNKLGTDGLFIIYRDGSRRIVDMGCKSSISHPIPSFKLLNLKLGGDSLKELVEKLKRELDLLKLHIHYGDLHLATWSIEKIEEIVKELEEELESLEFQGCTPSPLHPNKQPLSRTFTVHPHGYGADIRHRNQRRTHPNRPATGDDVGGLYRRP